MKTILESSLLAISAVEKQVIIDDFENKINLWCEMTAKKYKLPEEKMCQIAVDTFSSYASAAYIRKLILPRFKNSILAANRKNKTMSPMEKKERVKQLAKKLGLQIVGKVVEVVEPIHQSTVILSQDDEE